jgi:hypothetical protein
MFGKIKLENINYRIADKSIIFSTLLRDPKQMLLAAGRIHQHTTHGTGEWTISAGSILLLELPTSSVDKNLNKIKEAFNQMVS